MHAHPVALVAFSLVHRIPDTRLFHQARLVCGEAGFAPYELPGSLALGRNVAALFGQGFDCVLLENHGAVTGGANLQEAFRRFETLEFTAKTIIKAHMLGEVRYLTDEEIATARDAAPEWTAFPDHEAGSHEKELRARLAEFVRRAYRQRLFISTQGSFSARVDATSFLITPYQQDRGTIDVHDLVLVRDGDCETGGVPSRAARIHEEIYRRHPEIGAIINAYPVNATAFSVTGAPLDSRTIPESYIVIREVSRFPYGLQFCDAAGAGRRDAAAPSCRVIGKRRRDGDRRRHTGGLRSPGGAGVHGRGDHQLPDGRDPGADAGCGHSGTGSRVSGRIVGMAASKRTAPGDSPEGQLDSFLG